MGWDWDDDDDDAGDALVIRHHGVKNVVNRKRVRQIVSVLGTGAVAGATVTADPFASPSVTACLVRYARTWQMPAPEGGGMSTVTQVYGVTPPTESE